MDTLEDEREFDTSEIERKVTSPDSNRKIVEEIAKYAQEHERIYGHFPKTLIFGANDLQHTSHCDTLVDICRDERDKTHFTVFDCFNGGLFDYL